MGARYNRVSLDFTVEFAGRGENSIEPTLEQQQDPRFLAFLEWYREIYEGQARADILAHGPGNITFF